MNAAHRRAALDRGRRHARCGRRDHRRPSLPTGPAAATNAWRRPARRDPRRLPDARISWSARPPRPNRAAPCTRPASGPRWPTCRPRWSPGPRPRSTVSMRASRRRSRRRPPATARPPRPPWRPIRSSWSRRRRERRRPDRERCDRGQPSTRHVVVLTADGRHRAGTGPGCASSRPSRRATMVLDDLDGAGVRDSRDGAIDADAVERRRSPRGPGANARTGSGQPATAGDTAVDAGAARARQARHDPTSRTSTDKAGKHAAARPRRRQGRRRRSGPPGPARRSQAPRPTTPTATRTEPPDAGET